MNLNQIAVGFVSFLNQASDQVNGFGGWVSEKTGELKDKFSEVVWAPAIVTDNDKEEVSKCPLESFASLFPNTQSDKLATNTEALEEGLAAIPPTFTGQFDQKKLNEETHTSAAAAAPAPFRVRF